MDTVQEYSDVDELSNEEEADPSRDNVLTILVLVLHSSIDVGMRNLGIFAVLVEVYTFVWHEIVLVSTFDICEGVETGGTKMTSRVAENAVELLDSLTVIHPATKTLIEEQFISTGFGRKTVMNDEARRLQSLLLGYISTRKKVWNVPTLEIYRIPSVLKLRGCPKELRKNKPKYKEWTRLKVVDILRERGFNDEADMIEDSKKGDDVGDAVKQYVEAMEEIKKDPSKYRW